MGIPSLFLKGGIMLRIEISTIGEFCKLYRKNILKITLQEMENRTGVKIPTLSSFENNRSSNTNHISLYYSLGSEKDKKYFRENLPLERVL